MVAMATSASYISISSSNHGLGVVISGEFVGIPTILDVHKSKRKSVSYRRLRVQANANVPAKWMMHNQSISRQKFDHFGLGSKVNSDGFLFHQTFTIRSYEIGVDGKASVETIMNHLQEAGSNYGKVMGVLGDSFGSSYKNLIWVVARMQVEVARYPTWGDVTQIDEPCLSISKKHGLRCDWLICDFNRSEVLVRASSNMVLMNKSTRRLSKISDEIRAKLDQFVVDKPPDLMVKDTRILPKLDETNADHVCSGLLPRWSDLDINEHVNNVKYIGWILESVPKSIVKHYEIASMTLEYHQECGKDCMLQSLTSLLSNDNDGSNHIECHHMLRLEDSGRVIVKGWTRWRPKYQNS